MRNLPALTERILKSYRVTLASASPRRAELIKKIDWLEVDIVPSNVEEFEYDGGAPETYACKLAEMKAREVYSRVGGVVIGADTVVYCGGRVLGKPRNASDAAASLEYLCGRTHEVVTGFVVLSENKFVRGYEKTFVTFGDYDREIISQYVESGAPLDKAGSYGLQDKLLAPLIREVRGDRDNVIGLPVAKLEKSIKELN